MAAAAKIDGQEPPTTSLAPPIDGQEPPTTSLAPPIDGQDKVIATAQQIVKSLATNKTAAEDMLRILSTFDHRFSSINVFPSSSSSPADDDEEDTDVVDRDGDGGDGVDGEGTGDGEADEVRLEIEAKLDEADKVITRWDSLNSDSLFESSPEEIGDYLFVVDELISVARKDEFEYYGDLCEKAEILIQIAMSRLEDELRHLMIQNTVPLDAAGLHSSISCLSLSFASDAGENETLDEEFDTSNEAESSADDSSHHHHHQRQESPSLDERSERFTSLSEDHRKSGLIRPEAVADLKDISDRMIHSNYHKELCQVYSSVRREILDECLSVLGVDRMSIDEVQRIEWKNLDDKMRKWIQSVKVAIRVLLTGERRLCDQIFAESDQLREECFVESTKGCVMQLLNFGDAIAIRRRSSEKLFRILDMYEALLEVKPNLDELFVGDSGKYIINEAERILEWLSDTVRGTLAEFASAVQKETSRKPMQGGEIHPLTRYVMNYVKLLVDYSCSLESLLDDDGVDSEEVVDCGENETRLGHRLRLLISYLESNLENKSKFYEDAALQFIFLMNNRLYIVQKVKDSDLGKILGENWVRKRRGQIRQYHNSYLRASWTKALSFLKDDGLGGSGSASSVSKVALKERFRNFNLAFEEIYKTQTTWKVPDPQLREELRLSTSEKIIPAYRSFLGRFGGQLETARHAAKYIKYTPEDLEGYLLEFFEGSSGLSNHPRRKLSSS